MCNTQTTASTASSSYWSEIGRRKHAKGRAKKRSKTKPSRTPWKILETRVRHFKKCFDCRKLSVARFKVETLSGHARWFCFRCLRKHREIPGEVPPAVTRREERSARVIFWDDGLKVSKKRMKQRAAARRKRPTKAESRFSKWLESNHVKHLREVVIGWCIVDFYLPSFKTVVEIDGGYHEDETQKAKDASRTDYLMQTGVVSQVIRITNEQVFANECERVLAHLAKPDSAGSVI